MFYQFLYLLVIHWIADFILQTHWQASNKSKRLDALSKHIGTYTLALAIGSVFIFSLNLKWVYFVIINGILHFITDYFTSKLSSKLYAKQDYHNFFVVIGFDQLIHQITLAFTIVLVMQ